MDRSSKVSNVASECDATWFFAECERQPTRLHLLWSVLVRDMSAIFGVMTQGGETRAAHPARDGRLAVPIVGKWTVR